MPDHDIQLLTLGFAAGADVVLLVLLLCSLFDDRRDRKALRATKARLQAARATDDA